MVEIKSNSDLFFENLFNFFVYLNEDSKGKYYYRIENLIKDICKIFGLKNDK